MVYLVLGFGEESKLIVYLIHSNIQGHSLKSKNNLLVFFSIILEVLYIQNKNCSYIFGKRNIILR